MTTFEQKIQTTNYRINNPWIKCVKNGRQYICKDDETVMEKYKNHFFLEHPPCPYNGDPDAPIYILMNNPAPPNENDLKAGTRHLKDNLRMSAGKFIGLEYSKSWWTHFFSGLMAPIGHYDAQQGLISPKGQAIIYRTFFAIEISGYYSLRFNYEHATKLPSSDYSRQLVTRAESKIFLKPRSNDYWYRHVPKLARSGALYTINGTRRPVLKIGSVAPAALELIYETMGNDVLEKYRQFLEERYAPR